MPRLLIYWNNYLINWFIGKLIVLNPRFQLLNVRISFTVKGHVHKAELVSRCPDYPSGRCLTAHANLDVSSLVEWLSTWYVLSNQLYCIVGTINEHCLRWWWLPDQPNNWKLHVFLDRLWINAHGKGHGLNKSSDGIYTHHDTFFIFRLAQDLCILLLSKCHCNVDHQNWQRMLATLWKRFWRERLYIVGLQSSFLQLCCL